MFTRVTVSYNQSLNQCTTFTKNSIHWSVRINGHKWTKGPLLPPLSLATVTHESHLLYFDIQLPNESIVEKGICNKENDLHISHRVSRCQFDRWSPSAGQERKEAIDNLSRGAKTQGNPIPH